MRNTLVAFILGVVLAGGVAYLTMGNRPDPQPPAVSVVEPNQPETAAVVEEPPRPSVVDPQPLEAPRTVSAKRDPAPPKRPKRVNVAHTVESPSSAAAPSASAAPAAAATPAQPAPVEPYTPELPTPAVASSAPFVTEPEKPAPAPEPARVTIPSGTLLAVRLAESLSSDRDTAGDTFTGTLAEPLVIDGFEVAVRGARVEGRIVEADRGGRVKGLPSLSVQLTKFTTADGQKVSIQTDVFERQGTASTGKDAAKIGAAAAIGAAIGAMAGGGKGAAIGAGVGGAAGTGGVLATRGKGVDLPVETKLSFRLSAPVTVTERRSPN